MRKKLRGWALMSMMLAIIGTIFIMAIALFKIPTLLDNSKEAKAAQLTATVGSLVSQYKLEIGKYPDTLNDLTKEDGQYGPWIKEIPKDPFAGSGELQYKKVTKPMPSTVSARMVLPTVLRTVLAGMYNGTMN